MKMIRHKHPGIDIQCALFIQNSQFIEEITAIRIAKEYLFPFDSPSHDMMQNTGGIQSCLSWHGFLFAANMPTCISLSARTSASFPFFLHNLGFRAMPGRRQNCWDRTPALRSLTMLLLTQEYLYHTFTSIFFWLSVNLRHHLTSHSQRYQAWNHHLLF